MCSPRGEVIIQESCFLKGFCKTLGILGGHGRGRELALKKCEGGRNGNLVFWLIEAVLSLAEGSLHLPLLRKKAKISSVSPPTTSPSICLETGNHLKTARKGELAEWVEGEVAVNSCFSLPYS